jgi:hypothetical protein
MKDLYKPIFAVILMLAGIELTGSAQSQVKPENIDKIKSQRIAFYTEQLNLTPAEAEKFWPLYNEFADKKLKNTAEEKRLIESFRENKASLTDNEIDNISKKIIQLRKDQVALWEEYYQKFRQVLPARKVLRLISIENQFWQLMLNGSLRPLR